MSHRLRPRRVPLDGNCHLDLDPDAAHPDRYLVRFCGLPRDAHARAATESARVRLMLANLRGEAPFPSPLPERIGIGWLDRRGWHPGRSPLVQALAAMQTVCDSLRDLDNDLALRVALFAAARDADGGDPAR